jgi:NAD-dependent deacetylase
MSNLPSKIQESIKQAARIIKESQHGVVLSGAGISTPSGIPDFRSAGSGLWSRVNPFEVASLTAFRTRPENFFDWLRPFASLMKEAQPNPAHDAVAELQAAGHIKTIITQNIDGLHQRAGASNVLEVHGSFNTLTCVHCYEQQNADDYIDAFIDVGTIPSCPGCENILKPDVVLFEEQLPIQVWLDSKNAIESCDLLLVTGSSLEVIPVANLPFIAAGRGARIIIVNHTQTPMSAHADVVIQEDVAIILPQIAMEVIGG